MMEKMFLFLSNHWFLWSLFVIIAILLVYLELRERSSGVKKVTPQVLVNLINHEDMVVIDVRSKEAFDNGHILGAKNLPFDEFEQRKATWENFKSQAISLVCPSDTQSIQIGAKLQKLGIKEICILQGGINAWKNAGLPLKHH
ncbi:MAG: rhodanese-like domain-containing protein [Gammaproteobacteria bacterium]